MLAANVLVVSGLAIPNIGEKSICGAISYKKAPAPYGLRGRTEGIPEPRSDLEQGVFDPRPLNKWMRESGVHSRMNSLFTRSPTARSASFAFLLARDETGMTKSCHAKSA